MSGAHVVILMGVKDGARFLPAQLASIAGQTHRDWALVAADDGSRDDSRAILSAFARAHPGRVRIVAGSGRGAPRTYLDLIARHGHRAPFAALADQDDVWLPDKLARALAWHAGRAVQRPALYCGATTIVDAAARPCRPSLSMPRPPSFANALTQSIAGGNTMVMNRALATVAGQAGGADPAAHDWFLYQLATGAGGAVGYDPAPVLLYRQHGRNLHGANTGPRAAAARLAALLRGEYRRRNGANLAALRSVAHLLTPEAQATLRHFARARMAPGGGARLAAARAGGLTRQRAPGQLGFLLATFLRLV